MRTLWLAVVGCLALLSCKTAPEVKADVVPPTLPEQEFQVVTQSLTDVSVKLTGTVEAGQDAITIDKAVYEFVVEGTLLKSGETALNLSAEAGQKAPFELKHDFTYVKDGDDLKAMNERGGSLLLALRGKLLVTVKNAAGSTQLELPFARSKEVRTPRLPHVKFIDYEAGRFSESEMQVVFHVGVTNTNPFVISISSLQYAVELAGKKVNEATVGLGDKVDPASTGVFDVTGTLNEETHAKDAKKVIKSLVVPYVITGQLKTPMYEEALDAKGDVKLNPPTK